MSIHERPPIPQGEGDGNQQHNLQTIGTAEENRELLQQLHRLPHELWQRANYSHSTSLLWLESTALKTLSLTSPEQYPAGKLVALRLLHSGKAAALEGRVKLIPFGEHMRMDILHYRATNTKRLSCGTVIQPGNLYGELHIDHNLPELGENDNLVGFTKRLFRSTRHSLGELATHCQENDPRLNDIRFFYGASHVVGPLATRLGFDVYPIRNPVKRILITWACKDLVLEKAGKNTQWHPFLRNFKSAKEAFISRQKLVSLYGSP